MFDIEDFVAPSALDPTPETPVTPLDNIHIALTGLAAFSTPSLLTMLARVVPAMLPGVVMGLCGGVLGLLFYSLLRGPEAKIKGLIYGLCGLCGVLAGGWDYLWLVASSLNNIGAGFLLLGLVSFGLLICLLLKGVFNAK